MKAITIWQPWASLIACGAKKFETRSWKTDYRGPIAIHAAKKQFDTDMYSKWALFPFAEALGLPDIDSFDRLPYGCVIAVAELINCWRIVHNPGTNLNIARTIQIGAELDVPKKHPDFHKYIVPTEQELLFGDWTPSRYAWELVNIKVLPEPIPAKGMQRLWNWKEC
jgi:hypothetical protein